ncbi:UNVERIFIED_CONTAM: hypothetical protein O8I53_06435 [Campylobacter lari]
MFHHALVKRFGNLNFVDHFQKNDPYDLFIKYSFRFEDVDNFAIKLNPQINSVQRIRGFAYYSFLRLEQNNDTFFSLVTVLNEIFSNIKYLAPNFIVTESQVLDAIMAMITRGEVYFDNEKKYIGLTSLRKKESDIAN